MYRFVRIATIVAALAALPSFTRPAAAQEGFRLGYTDVGATIGIGGIGDASVAIGGRFEHALRSVPDLGDGLIGIQVVVDYYSWSEPGFRWSYIPGGATENYHFKLEKAKIGSAHG